MLPEKKLKIPVNYQEKLAPTHTVTLKRNKLREFIVSGTSVGPTHPLRRCAPLERVPGPRQNRHPETSRTSKASNPKPPWPTATVIPRQRRSRHKSDQGRTWTSSIVQICFVLLACPNLFLGVFLLSLGVEFAEERLIHVWGVGTGNNNNIVLSFNNFALNLKRVASFYGSVWFKHITTC